MGTFSKIFRRFNFLIGLILLTFSQASIAASTIGEQNILVFLISFQDKAAIQPFTVASAKEVMFGSGLSVNNFYLENSYGKTSFKGDVAGWFTIPMDSTSSCDTAKIASYAQQAAINAGYVLSNFNRFLYVAPGNSNCGNWGGSQAASYDGPFVSNFDVSVASHELGHNFGLGHASGMNCDTGVLGSVCPWLEYGDVLDTMGGGSGSVNKTVYTFHFSAAQKEKLGWLNANAGSLITTVSSSGTYTIEPFESVGTQAKALKILKSIDSATGQKEYYYLEYRQPIGFDSGLNNFGFTYDLANIFGGVTFHYANATNVFLLDMTPGSRPTGTFDDLRDGALVVGKSYSDSAAGLTVSVVSANSLGITVDIKLSSPCQKASPTVSISPSSQTGLAGSSLVYSVTVKNNDNSSCGPSTFNMQSVLPSGFVSSFSSSALAISPGASVSTNLMVTSSTSSVAGSYVFSASAINSVSNAYKGSASATYIVGTAKKGGGRQR